MLSIIAAVAENNAIGKDNKLIWHLPEDLKRFKKITNGKTIIMGRKTFESLGRILPNRKHIILCNDMKMEIQSNDVEIVENVENLKKYIDNEKEYFVIGGATIYKILMPVCKKLYITKIHQNFDGDVFFPEIDEKDWDIIEIEQGKKDENNPFNYEYITYIKKQ